MYYALHTELKYHRIFCLFLASGLLIIASIDFVLEVGHSLSHTNDYLTGTVNLHSHKIGGKIIVHHDHFVLEKIEKVVDKVGNHDSDKQLQTVQFLKFDQLKLILQKPDNMTLASGYAGIDYYYQLRLDQIFDKLLTPPPQIHHA